MLSPVLLPLLLACEATAPPPTCFADLGQLRGRDSLIYDLAWSPIDHLLLTGGSQSLRLVEVAASGRLVQQWHSVTGGHRFNSVMWAADGRHAIIPTGYAVQIIEIDRERRRFEEVARVRMEAELQRGALSPDQGHLLTCDRDGGVQLSAVSFDPPGIELLDAVQAHDNCTRVAWAPSGTRAASVGHDGGVPLWAVDTAAGTLTELDRLEAPEETGEVLWTHDEDRLLVGTFGDLNELWVVDVLDDQLSIASVIGEHQSGVGALDLDAGGARLLTGDHNHTVRLWSLEDEPQLLGRMPADGLGVHSVRFSHDERFVARTASQFQDVLTVMEVEECAATSR
jgi:hypothetical protein